MAHFLIVDDSGLQRVLIKKSLLELGHTFEECETGLDALELIKKNDYDLITLDLLMPKMTGEELLAELSNLEKTPPVIVVTAEVQNSIIMKCLKLGASFVLHKPVELQKLRKTIKELGY
jgi:CheY-like chemotaxis protein